MPITETVNEWTFTGDVQSWINEIIKAHPGLPFSEAKIEERGRGDLKRRDLTIYDQNGKPALSGEVRLPDRPDGRTPYSRGLLDNAHNKADSAGIPYFFTWNVNRFVLWKTFEAGTPIIQRDYKYWDITTIIAGADLAHPRVRQQIRAFLEELLEYYGAVYTEKEIVRSRPLDERFIHILESALEQPVVQTLVAISQMYSHRPSFKRDLDQWMRDKQGWLLSEDEQVIRDNLERAAKFSCYVLVNKIVFHTALRRKFRMGKVRIPTTISTGKELSDQLAKHFDEAKRATHDYETVFDGDFGDILPFLNDATVDSWRELLNQIEAFDFTKLDYDIIGHIFERLISPEERHRFGQHYTKTEIVDLINSFCIRKANDHVLDPACGGGTFLVRAYTRKRYLAKHTLEHAELLEQIKGVDISAYPAHLSTINLATRQLVDAKNYPLVARSDFFDVRPDQPTFHIPLGAAGGGRQHTMLQVGKLDAVVGNPPYVRQESLSKVYKKKLIDLVRQEFRGTQLSQRSDIYVYFFPHAAAFLRGPGSYLGLLTSIGWLDTDYGFKLQKFFLDHFRIIAILESSFEPWFTGARVTTAVTILQEEPDPEKRWDNLVRFVQIRKPLKELYPENAESEERIKSADELRDFIESRNANYVDDRWRIRVVQQEELHRQGCWKFSDDTGTKHEIIRGEQLPAYRGGKWGMYVHAPDIFFELLDWPGASLIRLGEMARIIYGVKTGADDFFFVRDITDEMLEKFPVPSEFMRKFGFNRRNTNDIRIVLAGDGSQHTIEAEYLKPEVHSVMELDSIEIVPEKLQRKVLVVEKGRRLPTHSHVRKYIQWGQRTGFSATETCKARAETREWYSLEVESRAAILWPKSQQYRHIVAYDPQLSVANCRLYYVLAEDLDDTVLCAVLNSTVVALFKHIFGRYVGREGSLDTEVVDVELMLVPDIRQITQPLVDRLLRAFDGLRSRRLNPLDEEFHLDDRQKLDDAVLEVMGIRDASDRERLRRELYEQVRKFYAETRAVEQKMQGFRRQMARRGKLTPRSIAAEIWEGFDKSDLRHFPDDFVSDAISQEIIRLAPAHKIRLINDLFQKGVLKANGDTYALRDPERASFAARILEEGHSGKVGIPNDPKVCVRVLAEHDRYRTQIGKSFGELAAEYSADEEWQGKIVAELWKLHRASR